VLRRTFIAASQSDRLRRAVSWGPGRRVAMRFVAGESLDDAVEVAADLNERGRAASLDHLGELVTDTDLAVRAGHAYLDVLGRLHEEGLEASVSIKLTQLGLAIDRDGCRQLVSTICEVAAELSRDVTIDMEGSDFTDATIDLVADLREEGHDHVGCAVQSYLHRTPDDVDRLSELGASLRLCKGAYLEPADIAYQDATEVDEAYLELAEHLIRHGTYPRFATHDHRIIHHVRNLARRHELPRDAFEFQMLYGVREPLQQELVDAGYKLRIYVPFGEEWYPYFMRRLGERPANVTFLLRAVSHR
jgi:proline dehydrogenase